MDSSACAAQHADDPDVDATTADGADLLADAGAEVAAEGKSNLDVDVPESPGSSDIAQLASLLRT